MNTNTINLIVQGAYKTKIITKRSRLSFARQLLAATDGDIVSYEHAANEFPEFTAPVRKYKRSALAGAIAFYLNECGHWTGFEGSETERLVLLVADKNARQAGFGPEYETDEDGDHVILDDGTRVVLRDAFSVQLDTLGETPFGDITDEQVDPESEDYENSVMVRPLAVIQAERQEEAERIRQERMAATILSDVEASDDADEDEDDWDVD